jgi:hypothetical protein
VVFIQQYLTNISCKDIFCQSWPSWIPRWLQSDCSVNTSEQRQIQIEHRAAKTFSCN